MRGRIRNRSAMMATCFGVMLLSTQVMSSAVQLTRPTRPAAASTDAPFAAGSLLPFTEIAAPVPSGVTTLTLSGTPAVSEPSYWATALQPADMTAMQLAVDSNPATLYAAPNAAGRQFVLFNNPTLSGIDTGVDAPVFVVEVASSNAPSITLYAGIDSNGDGQPQQSEQVCQITVASTSSGTARCVVDLRAANQASRNSSPSKSNVWVLVDVPQGAADTTYAVSLATQFPHFSFGVGGNQEDFIVTGPGQIPAATNFSIRLAWGDGVQGRTPIPGQRYLGAMTIDSSTQGDAIVMPIALTYGGGRDDRQQALSGHVGLNLYADGAQSFHYIYVDVPPFAATLTISSEMAGSVTTESAVLGLVRADFPDFSSSQYPAAAPSGTPAATWTLTSTTFRPTMTTIPVTPGRWYVTVQTSATGIVTLWGPQFTYTDTASLAPGIAPGAYYNPQRSGHGVFLSQSGGQQVLYWYTYLEDGTPTWYMAQDYVPDPPSAVWNARLYRINWDGSAVDTRTWVGDVTLTPVDGSEMIFSWHLDGLSGSERFTRLGAGACPLFNGSPTNFNGTWYVPAQSGYGMDILALPNLQFATFYFYDALGIARWGVGSVQPFAIESTMNVTQSSGFCPACDYRKIAMQPLGTMTIGYGSASSGSLSTSLSLQPPLSGAWTVGTSATARLTGSASACSQ